MKRLLLAFCTILLVVDSRVCPLWSRNDGEKSIRAIIMNNCGTEKLPRRYRASTDQLEPHYQKYHLIENLPPLERPNMTDYSQTNMSGSSQFCLPQLTALRESIPDKMPLLIVDLRMEAHGFLDDLPISFYCPRNWDRLDIPPSRLEQDELNEFRILNQSQGGEITVWEKIPGYERIKDPRPIKFKVALTQREAIQQKDHDGNIHSIRIPIPDHRRPRDAQITQLITLFTNLSTQPTPFWLHFHCQAGKGRTTTAMIMWDMFRNAHKVTFKDIVHRNYIFGGVNLENYGAAKERYRLPFQRERHLFLTAFYFYCQERLAMARDGFVDEVALLDWNRFLVSSSNSIITRTLVNQWINLE